MEAAGGQPVDFTFAACGGARVRHVRSNGQLTKAPSWALTPTPDRPQIEYVPENADLITIGIGGNDVGFSGIGTYCFGVPRCDEKIKAAGGGADPVAKVVAALEDDLVDTFIALRLRAPHASIVAIGYPMMLSNHSYAKRFTCVAGYSQLESSEVAWIQGLNVQLNDVIAKAASTAGVQFFNRAAVEAGSERHGLCGDDSYINLPNTSDDHENILHPTAAGHAAYGKALLDWGLLNLTRNPDATGTRPATVTGAPVRIEFMWAGSEYKPSDGDAIATVPGDSALKCVGQRFAIAQCSFAVKVLNAQTGAAWTAWVYSDQVQRASGLVGVDGTIDVNLVVPIDQIGGGSHMLTVETTTAFGEPITFVLPISTADFIPLTAPARLLDTRASGSTIDGVAAGGGQVGAGQILEVQIGGRAGVPVDAGSVVLNVTNVDATAAGYTTVYPCGEARPNASNLNYVAGQTVPNSVTARLGTDGKVCLYTYAASDLLVDVAGYIS
jgi:hypothetical protein